jgi:hypothetical protein
MTVYLKPKAVTEFCSVLEFTFGGKKMNRTEEFQVRSGMTFV